MKTNKEKYDVLYEQLKEKSHDYIRSVLPAVPEKYYAISTNYTRYKDGYFIEERPVEKAEYSHQFYCIEKPTRKDIEKLRSFLENLPAFTPDKIFLHWRTGGMSSADPLSKISIADGRLAWTAEELEQKLTRLTEMYAPKEGHIACAYCCKQRKPEDIHYDIIISPNWKHQGFRSPPRPYCKDNHCAGYDQMAHEG